MMTLIHWLNVERKTIAARENEYVKRKYNRGLEEQYGNEDLSYEKAMELRQLEREEREVQEQIRKKNMQLNGNEDDSQARKKTMGCSRNNRNKTGRN